MGNCMGKLRPVNIVTCKLCPNNGWDLHIFFFIFYGIWKQLFCSQVEITSSTCRFIPWQCVVALRGVREKIVGEWEGGSWRRRTCIRTKYNLMFNFSGKIEKFRMVPGSVNCSRFALSVSLKKNKIDLSTCSLHKRSPCNTVADTGIYCSAMHVLPAIFPLFKIDKDSWLKCYPWKLEWQSFMWLNIF